MDDPRAEMQGTRRLHAGLLSRYLKAIMKTSPCCGSLFVADVFELCVNDIVMRLLSAASAASFRLLRLLHSLTKLHGSLCEFCRLRLYGVDVLSFQRIFQRGDRCFQRTLIGS